MSMYVFHTMLNLEGEIVIRLKQSFRGKVDGCRASSNFEGDGLTSR